MCIRDRFGSVGSSAAKSKVVNHKVDQLKSGGYYVEVSGKIKDIFKQEHLEQVKDMFYVV